MKSLITLKNRNFLTAVGEIEFGMSSIHFYKEDNSLETLHFSEIFSVTALEEKYTNISNTDYLSPYHF